MGYVNYRFLSTREIYTYPIFGGMGEGMGMGMGGNMGMGGPPPDPPAPPPSPPPPPAPPAQEPHFVAVSAGGRPGSMYVDGPGLHYVASNGHVFGQVGTAIATPAGAIPGSLWVNDDANLRYIDASGIERQPSRTLFATGLPQVVHGSLYEDSTQLLYRQITYGSGSGSLSEWWNGVS